MTTEQNPSPKDNYQHYEENLKQIYDNAVKTKAEIRARIVHNYSEHLYLTIMNGIQSMIDNRSVAASIPFTEPPPFPPDGIGTVNLTLINTSSFICEIVPPKSTTSSDLWLSVFDDKGTMLSVLKSLTTKFELQSVFRLTNILDYPPDLYKFTLSLRSEN